MLDKRLGGGGEQGKRETRDLTREKVRAGATKGKGKGSSITFEVHSQFTTQRAHSCTTRTDCPVGLSPPTSDIPITPPNVGLGGRGRWGKGKGNTWIPKGKGNGWRHTREKGKEPGWRLRCMPTLQSTVRMQAQHETISRLDYTPHPPTNIYIYIYIYIYMGMIS